MNRVKNKVALVTGAGSGQGAAEAKMLAKEGAKVIATDINFDGVKKVVDEIRAEGYEATAFKHNVASKEEWEEIVNEAVKLYGPITVLVNNAGVLSNVPFEKATYEDWKRVLDINAWSQFVGIQTVLPHMKEAGIGSIINIASMAAVNSSGGLTAYTASKGASDALTRAAAIDLASNNIRVNSVLPGAIRTPMVEAAFQDEDTFKAALDSQPLGYMGTPEDLGHLIVYLASDESRFTTGASILIDGGFNVQAVGTKTKIER